MAQRSMDVLALLTVQNRAVDRSEEAQSLRDKKDVCTSFGVSSRCYNERRQLCERAASSRHRVLAALTQWLVGTLRAARQRGDDAGLLLRRADQSFGGRSCSAPAWLSRSRAHACLSRTRVASCMHRGSITSSQSVLVSMVAEEHCSGERGAVTKGATTARARIRFCPRNVFEHACAQGCSAHCFGRRTGASGACGSDSRCTYTHETYSRALLVWYSMRPPRTTCRQPRPSQPRPLPTWRRWTTIRRGAQALLRDTSACSRVASACPHEADAHADTRAASVGGAPR